MLNVRCVLGETSGACLAIFAPPPTSGLAEAHVKDVMFDQIGNADYEVAWRKTSRRWPAECATELEKIIARTQGRSLLYISNLLESSAQIVEDARTLRVSGVPCLYVILARNAFMPDDLVRLHTAINESVIERIFLLGQQIRDYGFEVIE
jgi:hypothetical protein